ncbi:MAG: SAM-dependent methyltransferase [Chitinophagaceae bacterium]|nr:SAM-dependent methyltransferase [Chitinophagaceae bacterium]
MNATTGKVYLVPSFIDEAAPETIPPYIVDAVKQCHVFFVENERTARRFLKSIWKEMVIDNYDWYTIHKAETEVKAAFTRLLSSGKNIGIISEAGCPGIADPGQLLVEAAQRAGAEVKPLVGPSSILLALMASGMNGQHFRFSGYLPIDNAQRIKAIKALEAEVIKTNCTQIFIETPYRNNQLLEAILKTCNPSLRLCIAVSITSPAEYIKTLSVGEWKKIKTDIHKKPAIFLLGGS